VCCVFCHIFLIFQTTNRGRPAAAATRASSIENTNSDDGTATNVDIDELPDITFTNYRQASQSAVAQVIGPHEPYGHLSVASQVIHRQQMADITTQSLR